MVEHKKTSGKGSIWKQRKWDLKLKSYDEYANKNLVKRQMTALERKMHGLPPLDEKSS